MEAFQAEVSAAAGTDARLNAAIRQVQADLSNPADLELRARRVVERLALVLQGSLLVRHGHPAVADAFCASRLAGDHGHAYGTLPAGVDFAAIISRATPKVGRHFCSCGPDERPVAGRLVRDSIVS